MARYVATLESPRTQEDVFAYLSDFSTTQEWDPGVAEAQRLDEGPIAVGSRFNVVAEFMGRKTPLVYAVVAYDAPHSITLRGDNATVISLDTIAFEPTAAGGTRVSYDADLTLKGPLGIGDPLLKLVFNRIGDRAVAGLRKVLGA